MHYSMRSRRKVKEPTPKVEVGLQLLGVNAKRALQIARSLAHHTALGN
jgi:hypothetical protein